MDTDMSFDKRVTEIAVLVKASPAFVVILHTVMAYARVAYVVMVYTMMADLVMASTDITVSSK